MAFKLLFPTSIEEAVALKKKTNGSYLGGGTVLMVNKHNNKNVRSHWISLEKITSLHEIKETQDEIIIGSACTFSQIEKFNAVKTYCKALWDSCVQIGGPQIRNLGTIGGNYCCNSPAADTVPAILALNCKIEYVEDLAVAFVFKKDNNRCGFRKVGKRNALAISSVTMAMNKSSNGEITVAVGCCGPSVIVCKKTSACLTEKKDIKEAKNLILTEISPIDDKWGTIEYKNIVCRNFLEDLYKEVVL